MTTTKPPVWFWIVGVIALIWNIFGVFAYLAKAFATDKMIAQMPEKARAEFLMEFPAWYTAAFAIAVFFGTLGALSLIIRKKWAFFLFILSALGAIVQHIYLFVNVDMTGVDYAMPILVIVVCLLLVWLAQSAITKGWLK